jgi:hypothetical protein
MRKRRGPPLEPASRSACPGPVPCREGTPETKASQPATSRSAAYYSLFHLLAEDAASSMFGGSDAAALRAVVCRAFQHATMKRAAQGFGAGILAEPRKSLLDAPSPELRLVAGTFVDLQQERHQADYDFGRPLIRTEAIDLSSGSRLPSQRGRPFARSALHRSPTSLRHECSWPPFSFTTWCLGADDICHHENAY